MQVLIHTVGGGVGAGVGVADGEWDGTWVGATVAPHSFDPNLISPSFQRHAFL